MKKSIAGLLGLMIVCALGVVAYAQKKRAAVNKAPYQTISPKPSAELQALLHKAVDETVSFKKIKPDNVAATLIDLRDANDLKSANVRGDEKIYPASVVKMFYMVALHQWLKDGRIKLTPELERGLKDMIVDSSNEATQYILDVLTDTASGGEMPKKEFAIWSYKRNAVNRYFSSLGYERINVNQKTFCEDAYGREQQFRNYKGENRNMLNTNATARLLAEIVLGKAVNAARSKMMMDLLKREPFADGEKDDQAHGFTGIALIDKKLTGAKLWSKAGWTSKTRHDAAYIETPTGEKFVLVVFTENMATDRDIIPMIAGKILDKIGTVR